MDTLIDFVLAPYAMVGVTVFFILLIFTIVERRFFKLGKWWKTLGIIALSGIAWPLLCWYMAYDAWHDGK